LGVVAYRLNPVQYFNLNIFNTMSYLQAPDNLPEPIDDGAARHLTGLQLPPIALQSTRGEHVNLSQYRGWLVIYCYPMTGVPGVPLPPNWDQIPGARGCTPQSNAYKEVHPQFRSMGVDVFGMSTQTTEYQQELAERLQLPFLILSDHQLQFQQALQLPTFESEHQTLLKRLTLIVKDGVIETVHYPVFPSDADAKWAMAYLKSRLK
jgi:peroxiredoxin